MKKRARFTLMKLTAEVSMTNIFKAAISQISFQKNIQTQTVIKEKLYKTLCKKKLLIECL